ncbi:MAG: IMPACT family protein [Nitriliruptoraceae bacterium]
MTTGDDPDADLLDTIARPVRTELEVTRSRFVTTLAPVTDQAGIDTVLAEVRAEHHDARHHCVAWVLGADGRLTRSNDDGEPAGTAGAPMLAVLTGAGLTDVIAVVSRYFGGTLLGAGGLVRAYGEATTKAVELAERVRRRWVKQVAVRADHAAAGRLEHQLRVWASAHGAAVAASAYDAGGATVTLVVPVAAVASLEELLASVAAHVETEVGAAEIRDLVG